MKLFCWLLDLIFPKKCHFCRKIIEKGSPLCNECRENLPWTKTYDERFFPTDSQIFCMAPLWYRQKVEQAICRYKFSGERHYANCFGGLMAECLESPGNYDVISWVPLSKARRRSRGYNQAELLAKVVAENTGIFPDDLLVKTKHTAAQSSLGSDRARRSNPVGVYQMKVPEKRLDNLRILLVDDVVTTGSTLHSCEKVLKEAGAMEISCLCFARARK